MKRVIMFGMVEGIEEGVFHISCILGGEVFGKPSRFSGSPAR
jgi:hypothetical protein